MKRPWTLAGKLGAVGAALLVMALASIGLTLWVTWQLEGGAAAVNEAGRMRMQTWRMAQTLAAGERGALQPQIGRLESSIELLRRGDPARPLFVPHGEASARAFELVRSGWAGLRAAWGREAAVSSGLPVAPASAASAVSAGRAAAQAEAFVQTIDAFVETIERQLARWTALLQIVQFTLLALAIAAAVTLLYAAYLFVFEPLARLQTALARVEAGDLAARVDVGSTDEFGALAAGFNRMAATLQGLYQTLEAKVVDRTERLEAERQRVAALYEASAFAERAETPEELAQGFARRMRRVARADAAAVRLVDETSRRYVLAGSDCLPLAMIEYERCVGAGDCLCGRPPAEVRTRVIPIRRDGERGRCADEGFERLVGVPLRLHERALGEVDLLYRSPVELDDEDRALLDALASHLAGALESRRAAALEREAAVAAERGLLARELHDSIAQGLAFVRIQLQLLRDALARGERPRIEHALAELDAGVKESTADVRELLLHFRTRTNAEDIVPALRTTLSKFEHQSGVASHLEVQGDGLPLPADTQVQVLHVVQEALSNVRKHAGARAVRVTLQRGPVFSVRVCDDGRGFAPDAARNETHVGLRIMRERAARIGAEVAVVSRPGGGTDVTLTLPAREALAA
ncbi:MAG: type IV pili methyl-accepting chemotaxis transducer N-terminal domain-containing protein [Proteobacteria bacterium]|nr:type IV pili methyl-accepting chemotaxis transducer N-terminal domain-containing protein [Pseudomonadota bacterium]